MLSCECECEHLGGSRAAEETAVMLELPLERHRIGHVDLEVLP